MYRSAHPRETCKPSLNYNMKKPTLKLVSSSVVLKVLGTLFHQIPHWESRFYFHIKLLHLPSNIFSLCFLKTSVTLGLPCTLFPPRQSYFATPTLKQQIVSLHTLQTSSSQMLYDQF